MLINQSNYLLLFFSMYICINRYKYIDSMFINAFSFDKNNISSWNCTNKFNSSMFNNKYIAYFTHIKNNIWLYVLFMLLLLFVFIYIC